MLYKSKHPNISRTSFTVVCLEVKALLFACHRPQDLRDWPIHSSMTHSDLAYLRAPTMFVNNL